MTIPPSSLLRSRTFDPVVLCATLLALPACQVATLPRAAMAGWLPAAVPAVSPAGSCAVSSVPALADAGDGEVARSRPAGRDAGRDAGSGTDVGGVSHRPASSAPVAGPALRSRLLQETPRAAEAEPGLFGRTFAKVATDYCNFYDLDTLYALGAGVGLAGLGANSDFDTEVQSFVRRRWTTRDTDAAAENILWLGDIKYMVPLTALAAVGGPVVGSDTIGEWGERTLRGFVLSAPLTVTLQRVTGGQRPAKTDDNESSWQFGEASHGVSGHAVVGAVSLLSIAKMTDDPWLDALCYAGSAAVALARVEQRRHYLSQAALGWWIGFLATEAVDDSMRPATARGTSIAPMLAPETIGFVVTHRF